MATGDLAMPPSANKRAPMYPVIVAVSRSVRHTFSKSNELAIRLLPGLGELHGARGVCATPRAAASMRSMRTSGTSSQIRDVATVEISTSFS